MGLFDELLKITMPKTLINMLPLDVGKHLTELGQLHIRALGPNWVYSQIFIRIQLAHQKLRLTKNFKGNKNNYEVGQ